MPELPDVTVYIEALSTRIVGHELKRVLVKGPFLLRSVTPSLSETFGRKVREIRRIGKQIAVGLDGQLYLAVHLMIAGRLHWKTSSVKLGGKNALAIFQFDNGTLLLTEAGTQRRAALRVVAGEEGLKALDAGGIEALDWSRLATDLDDRGSAVIKHLLEPAECRASNKGAIALNSESHICICDGSSWKFDSTGKSCTW